MVSPAAIIEMLIRFYGAGANRDFGEVLGIWIRKLYEAVRSALTDAVGTDVEDITDPNDEVSFGYLLDDYVLRLSMVGPFAVLLRREASIRAW